MKKGKVVLIVVGILVIVALLLVNSDQYSTLSEGESDFAVTDTAGITKIFIADKSDNSVLLERVGSGWILDGKHTANTRQVDVLLRTMYRMKVKSPVSLASHDNVVSRMAAIGKKVEVYQMGYRIDLFDKIKLFKHEKLLKVFYVGDATQNSLGTYMLMEGADNPYIVYLPSFRGFISTRFSPLVDDWKSHVIFNKQLSEIESISLKFGREPGNSFKVSVINAQGDYDLTRLLDGSRVESYDTLKVLNFLTSFRDLRYETRLNNIVSPLRIDSIVHSPSLYELTLVDHQKDTIFVKMFEKKASTEKETGMLIQQIPTDFDRFYALVNDGDDFVLMQFYVFNKVLYPLSYYEK